MTTQPENKDKAEQKLSKDELSEKELEKATGGDGCGAGSAFKNVSLGLRKSAGGQTSGHGRIRR